MWTATCHDQCMECGGLSYSCTCIFVYQLAGCTLLFPQCLPCSQANHTHFISITSHSINTHSTLYYNAFIINTFFWWNFCGAALPLQRNLNVDLYFILLMPPSFLGACVLSVYLVVCLPCCLLQFWRPAHQLPNANSKYLLHLLGGCCQHIWTEYASNGDWFDYT